MSPFLERPEFEWLASNELAFTIRDLYPLAGLNATTCRVAG